MLLAIWISIPYGAIKSLAFLDNRQELWVFQFLMVRLKERYKRLFNNK